MTDPRLTKWANTLCNYSLALEPGQQVLIRVDEPAIVLAKEVYRAALGCGAHPNVQVVIDGLDEIFLGEGSDAQLEWVSPVRKMEYDTVDALCAIIAPTNTASLAGIDPARQARVQKSNKDMRQRFFERTAANEANWVLTLFPTAGAAQNAGVSLATYEEFLYSAMFLNEADPADAWRAFSRDQQRYVDYLNRVDVMRFVAQDTDITMRVGGRTWLNSDGHRNFPSGEVFTGPLEDSVNGHVRFSFPAAHLGHEADAVSLTFEHGRVVDFDAAHGKDFLTGMLETDQGARVLGECAIGNNYGVQRYTKNTLYDEKIGGTFHLALGNSYAETGGQNESALHWDLVCDMRPEAGGGAVYADGVIIHENGQWKI